MTSRGSVLTSCDCVKTKLRIKITSTFSPIVLGPERRNYAPAFLKRKVLKLERVEQLKGSGEGGLLRSQLPAATVQLLEEAPERFSAVAVVFGVPSVEQFGDLGVDFLEVFEAARRRRVRVRVVRN